MTIHAESDHCTAGRSLPGLHYGDYIRLLNQKVGGDVLEVCEQ